MNTNYIIRFSITGQCQMHCTYCDHGNDVGPYLSTSNVIEILEACFYAGIRIIHWTGGEPTVRNDFVDIVRAAKDIGFVYQKMTTNGGNLYRIAEDLKEAGLNRVNISLDTLDSKKYTVTTKTKLFETVLNGIDLASSLLEHVKINTCITRYNFSEIIDFLGFAEKCSGNLIVKFLELVPCGNMYENDHQLFNKDFISIKQILGAISNEYLVSPISHSPQHSRQKCQYYRVVNTGVIFGLNPNLSISYACQKSNCRDLRINPHGFMSDCSLNLTNLVNLSILPLELKKVAVQQLVTKKSSRTEEEWGSYQHKQKYYSFWRFGNNFDHDMEKKNIIPLKILGS